MMALLINMQRTKAGWLSDKFMQPDLVHIVRFRRYSICILQKSDFFEDVTSSSCT